MSGKIYEYKDQNNWFIAEWSIYQNSMYYDAVRTEDFSHLEDRLRSLVRSQERSFRLTLVKCQTPMLLVRFLLDIINQEEGRQLEARQHSGAILITEGELLLDSLLPKGGLPLSAFLNQKEASDFGETILIATRNEGKTAEFRSFFEKLGYGVENLNAYPDLPEVAETGLTFEENARLKAETIAELTGKMVLADDSGLKVDILGGLPGVWSARFSGPNATDETNNQKLLHELATVFDLKDRSAQFHAALVLAKTGKPSLVVEADWPGYIAFDLKGDNGFGYDPLFLVGETGRRSAELSLEEKNQQSHRALALNKLLEAFPKW